MSLDHIDCFVFDFGGTYSSAPYFWVGPEVCADWRVLFERYVFEDRDIFDGWMDGRLGARDVAKMMAGYVQMDVGDVLMWMEKGLRDLSCNEAVVRLAKTVKKLGKKTVLVTANIDLFSSVIVPDLGLENCFDVIVNSADYGDLDKAVLWPIAFDRVGGDVGYAQSFLIEDAPHQVALFRQLGGMAHHYESDEGLLQWLGQVGFVIE